MQSLATFGLNRQLRRLSLQQTRFPVSLASSNRFQFDKRRRLSTEELRDEDSDIDTNLAMSMELHDPMDIRLAELVDAPPRKFGKIPPGIKNARLAKMRFYEGKEKNIRGSPWKLNLVCQLAAGLPVDDALKQLTFCDKGKAPLAFNVIKRTANLAEIRDGLQHSQLEVAECFATVSTMLKRVQFMGRGRIGKKYHRHANFNVKLREIDFELKIAQAQSRNQKRKWFGRYLIAKHDGMQARKEFEEMAALEKAAAEVEQNRTKKV